jgi:hypothetical protein
MRRTARKTLYTWMSTLTRTNASQLFLMLSLLMSFGLRVEFP